MIRKLLALLLLFQTGAMYAQESLLQPRVEERIELMGIMGRLAGFKEYNTGQIENYNKATDKYFEPFLKHKAIAMIQKLRKRRGVSYDAVMSMAIHLKIDQGEVTFDPNSSYHDLDQRWGRRAKKFVHYLNDFYQESKFHDFYVQNQQTYAKAEADFSELIVDLDQKWFLDFYGTQPEGSFNVILALTNGTGNYGPHIKYNDGTEDIFSIVGWSGKKEKVLERQKMGYTALCVHEFSHSFCNPLIYANYEQMEEVAESFFKLSEDVLRQQAYGSSKTMCCEILVRAATIRYFKEHGTSPKKIKQMMVREVGNGFLWMDELMAALDDYAANRDQYPTLSDYMPKIVEVQNALNPEMMKVKIMDLTPQFVECSIKDGDQNVDPKTAFISISFDREMNTSCNGSSYGKKGKKYFVEIPEGAKARWSKSANKWSLPVKLKPNTEYSISFPGRFFAGGTGFSPDGVYYVDFKTAE